jgi:hypothetical protein
VAAGVALIATLYYCLKKVRDKHKDPKYVPTQFLKKRWVRWRANNPKSSYRHSTTDHLEPISESSTLSNNRASRVRQAPSTSDAASGNVILRTDEVTAAGVDRNTSVRSVMTLPAYRPAPGESEQVLGREGERGGIDVVVEYPETVDEIEEQRREEEMEALYQVRLARRTEAAEREELRRLRREARQRNDWVALEEIRARSRAASNARGTRTLDELRAEHARLRDRQRASSSVNYADLGVARHDGTRIRANSEESERPLLGDAASMASSYHRRDRSASSVLSIDSDLPSPGFTRSRANSRTESNLRQDSAAPSGAMSSPELVDAEHDIGDEDFPTHSPPEYEDIALQDTNPVPTDAPPDYSSPVDAQAPELRLPIQGATEHQSTNSSQTSAPRPAGRGVGGTPQLPSLRLSALPSIVVDTPTPISSRTSAEDNR